MEIDCSYRSTRETCRIGTAQERVAGGPFAAKAGKGIEKCFENQSGRSWEPLSCSLVARRHKPTIPIEVAIEVAVFPSTRIPMEATRDIPVIRAIEGTLAIGASTTVTMAFLQPGTTATSAFLQPVPTAVITRDILAAFPAATKDSKATCLSVDTEQAAFPAAVATDQAFRCGSGANTSSNARASMQA